MVNRRLGTDGIAVGDAMIATSKGLIGTRLGLGLTSPLANYERRRFFDRNVNSLDAPAVSGTGALADKTTNTFCLDTRTTEVAQPLVLHEKEGRSLLLRRLIYNGPLQPETGVFEFLEGVIDWVASRPDFQIDLTWRGTGDLKGILQAQPTPSNLLQIFAEPDILSAAGNLPDHDVFIQPGAGRPPRQWILQARDQTPDTSRQDPSAVATSTRYTGWWIWDLARRNELLPIFEAAMLQGPG